MNKLSTQNRLLIGVVSTLIMLFVFVFPSELTSVWESRGFQGVMIAIIISLAAIQIASIAKIFKPIPWIEALPLLLAIALIWTSLFVVEGTFQVAPGNYRYIQPSFLIISVPMFMLITSAILAVITLLAPADDRRSNLKAQDVVLGWKRRYSSRYSRRAAIKGSVAILGTIFVIDFLVRTSVISTANACIEEKFQQGWRSAYLGEPWQVSFTWSKQPIPGFEERGDWWASPTEPYRGPKDWSDFVKEVSVDGIPATLIKNGVRSSGRLLPMALDEMYHWAGFDFDAYVFEIKTACTDNISPPLFPIANDWEYGEGGVKNSISDIDGYVAPVESVTP